jgi:hypothetical protein
MVLLGLSALIVPLVELAKFIYRKMYPKEAEGPPPSMPASSLPKGALSRRG